MATPICPYLGLKNDKETVMQFPSTGNYCFHVSPVEPVDRRHQEIYCLHNNHINCPVYNSALNLPMPPEIIGVLPYQKLNKKIVMAVAILFIFVVMIIILLSSNFPKDNEVVLESTKGTVDSLTQTIPAINPIEIMSKTTLIQNQNTPIVEQTWIQCTQPTNWIVYVVKPTDSLVRLALIFNVTVEDLQKANCMGDRTLVKPGEKIYVPGATPTPSSTFTPTNTATRTYQAPIIPFWTNTPTAPNSPPSQPRPTNTPLPPPPPTATQPPPPPPTAVPPTEEPPTPTAPPI
ncbi:MAG: hypothetical protein CL609_08540 [Anaerolineaceae bacterium]|nr:hypothetical protein [Anaerolineaceae bacterium]